MHPVCGQLYERRPLWRSRHLPSVSCCLSAAAVSFSGHPVPAQTCAVLTDGLPTAGQFRWTTAGLPCSALARYDRCRAPPFTPGPWCSHDRRLNSGHHCRLPATGPVPRSHIPSTAVLLDEAYRDSLAFTLPVFPLPVTDGWN